MAVISVVGDWRALSLQQNGTSLTVPVKFIVTFDDGDDPILRPLLARVAVDPHAEDDPIPESRKIPTDSSGHPYTPWLYLRNKDVDCLESAFVYSVICTYTNEPMATGSDSQREMFANPCDQPWGIKWGSISIPQRIDMGYDEQGNPTKRLCNVNGEPFDPPLQEDMEFQTLTITRNILEWDDLLMSQYGNVTNTDIFWRNGPGTVLCKMPTAERMQHANIFYFAATYSFIFTPNEPGWTWGWQRRLLNEGYYEAANEGTIDPDTGRKEIVRALGDDDSPTPLPVPLRLNGTRIYPRPPGVEPEPGVPIYFTTKREKAFALLGVNR